MPRWTAAFDGTSDRRLIAATWSLLLLMGFMLMVSLLCVLVESWLRIYAHGCATWMAAEHEAIYDLRSYADSGRETDYRQYRRQIDIPLADRDARLQLQSPHPDYDAVRRSLLAGRGGANDIPGAIRLFRLFHEEPAAQHILRLWSTGDALALEMAGIGTQLHAEITSGHPDPQRLHALIARADAVHARITPLMDQFESTLGDASRRIARLLLIVIPLASLVPVAAGIGIARVLTRRSDRSARRLRRLAQQLEFRATHDSLTGLTNRAQFETLLATAIARARTPDPQGGAVLLYFDLDQLKVVNDTCGHAAGDELIKQVAWRILRMMPAQGTLARLGGDEFGVLLPRCGVAEALGFADRIREQLNDLRFFWDERTFAVSASIGVVALDEHLPTVADALSAADQACYLAKDNGRNRVQLYRPDDQQVRLRHGEMRWVERLQAALDRDRFELVAQEIVPVGTAGGAAERRFELLLRMMDTQGELIAPMAFIPAAERYGLMPRIDRWVIARACRELGALRGRGGALPACTVNLSGTSVSDPGLAEYIAECLRRHGLPGSCLGVELTETAAVSNLDSCSQLMAQLRALGCPIALDDFGTGMSSFSYLRSLPIDYLKIDRAFVRDIATDPIDFALVETIQRIGGIIGVRTVAEGVESEAVLAALARIGINYAQGTHIAKPLPLAQTLGSWRPAAAQLLAPTV
ncbi:MAG TPA: EAL domain-containing protein [Steroidobacteraceae bacterium]|nr:EAL domain-containing protein [Steroidobacteraceae bacterium]